VCSYKYNNNNYYCKTSFVVSYVHTVFESRFDESVFYIHIIIKLFRTRTHVYLFPLSRAFFKPFKRVVHNFQNLPKETSRVKCVVSKKFIVRDVAVSKITRFPFILYYRVVPAAQYFIDIILWTHHLRLIVFNVLMKAWTFFFSPGCRFNY